MSDHLRACVEQQSVLSALIRAAETLDSKIWKLCYPRHYQVESIYPSPKQLAAELACIYSAYVGPMDTTPCDLALLSQAMCGVAGLVLLQVPIFFVAPDLFQAVQLSIPPVDLDWANLHLPFDSAAFALPRGSLSHTRYGEIGYIWYSRIHKGKPFPSLAEAKCEGIARDDYFLIRGTCMEWSEAPSFQRLIQRSETPTLNLKDFGAVVGSKGSGVNTEGANVIAAATTLVFSLLFAMNARSDLWNHGKPNGKTAKRGLEFWTPNILGKHYVLKDQRSGTHGGSSPRMHWRRGHMRQQPYGEAHRLRREQWIEPALIASE